MEAGLQESWTPQTAPPIGLVAPCFWGAGGQFPATALATVSWFITEGRGKMCLVSIRALSHKPGPPPVTLPGASITWLLVFPLNATH